MKNEASMRPRLIAVDDRIEGYRKRFNRAASMRPRLIAVDDNQIAVPSELPMSRFNEATADRRG